MHYGGCEKFQAQNLSRVPQNFNPRPGAPGARSTPLPGCGRAVSPNAWQHCVLCLLQRGGGDITLSPILPPQSRLYFEEPAGAFIAMPAKKGGSSLGWLRTMAVISSITCRNTCHDSSASAFSASFFLNTTTNCSNLG
jgi:hypothetical protein